MVLRKNDGFNDFKTILSDGIVFANSAIMSSASDYFVTMLGSDKFVEDGIKEIPMKEYGTKKAMGWMVLYCGDMNVEKTARDHEPFEDDADEGATCHLPVIGGGGVTRHHLDLDMSLNCLRSVGSTPPAVTHIPYRHDIGYQRQGK